MFPQNKYTISGYITDENNGESIVGANVYCKDLSVGVTSNTYGFYSLTPLRVITIFYSFIGYKNQKNIQLTNSIRHDVEFELSSANIQEVTRANKSIVEQTQTHDCSY